MWQKTFMQLQFRVFRLIARWRFQLYRKWFSRNDRWVESYEMLRFRTQLLLSMFMDDYRPEDGLLIEMQIGIHHAEMYLMLLTEFKQTLDKGDYLSSELTGVHLQRKTIRFDDWLSTKRGGAISVRDLMIYHRALVNDILTAMEKHKSNPTMYRYYNHKSGEFLHDLFVILEALEKLAYQHE